MVYIPVGGTNAWSDDSDFLSNERPDNRQIRWWQEGSAFDKFMNYQDFQAANNYDPFIWTTDLGGLSFIRRLPIINRYLYQTRDHRDWIAGGAALRWYIQSYNPDGRTNVIAHSHGLQVVAYACEQGLKVDQFITVGSPIRKDMYRVYYEARKNIRQWLHIYDGNNDRIQFLGQLGDGSFFKERTCIFANYNESIPNIRHSRILSDPEAYHYWTQRDWIGFLSGNWPKNKESINVDA